MQSKKHKLSVEKLSHFKCGDCGKWWSIGDIQEDEKIEQGEIRLRRKEWFCPWCGLKQPIEEI